MKATLGIYGIKDRSEKPTFVHDHNLCLMYDGKIMDYLHLERYSREKYDNKLENYIEELIENNKIKLPNEFDVVLVNSFEGNSFISKNGKIKIESGKLFSNPPDIAKNSFSRFLIENIYEEYCPNTYTISHELSHIFSIVPFYGEFKENSLLVHFDGGASVGNFSAFIYKGNNIKCIKSDWEYSYLSKIFNNNAVAFKILGAKPGEHTSVPGKLMGLASFGEANIKIENWIRKNLNEENGEFFYYVWTDEKRFFDDVYKEMPEHLRRQRQQMGV